MLILTRRESEAVITNGPVVISVVEIRGDKVRLAFHAADGVKILRDEVWTRSTGLLLPDGIFKGRREQVALLDAQLESHQDHAVNPPPDCDRGNVA